MIGYLGLVDGEVRSVHGECGRGIGDCDVRARLAGFLPNSFAGDDADSVVVVRDSLSDCEHEPAENEHSERPEILREVGDDVTGLNDVDGQVVPGCVRGECFDGRNGSCPVVGAAVVTEVDVDWNHGCAAFHELPGGDRRVDTTADEGNDGPLGPEWESARARTFLTEDVRLVGATLDEQFEIGVVEVDGGLAAQFFNCLPDGGPAIGFDVRTRKGVCVCWPCPASVDSESAAVVLFSCGRGQCRFDCRQRRIDGRDRRGGGDAERVGRGCGHTLWLVSMDEQPVPSLFDAS